MKDDELLAELKKATARDPERARSPRWERLAKGDADADERRALDEIARADGDDDAVAALAPPSDEYRARVLDAVMRAKTPDNVRRFPMGSVVAVVAGLAMAAAVALYVGRPRSVGDDLPAYALTVGGSELDVRGAPAPSAAPARLGPDARLRLVVRPERQVAGPLEVHLFIARDGNVTPWSAPYDLSSAGVVQISGPATMLIEGPNGPREIVVAVGRPGSVPATAAELARAPSSAKYVVFRAAVEIIGRP